MSNNFTISEFVIDKTETFDYKIADKILKYHISIIQPIRDKMDCPIWPSQNSGYRSINWEIAHSRSGTSQHCFKEKGAVDYTCDTSRLNDLYDALVKSDYMRVCLYPTFIHCDHYGHTKQLFSCTGGAHDPWLSA